MAVVSFFVIHGIGLIIGGLSMYRAYSLYSDGSKYGVFALLVAGLALLAVIGGWFLRAQGVAI